MPDNNISTILITFGGLFLLGLIADLLGRHTPLPRVTLLIVSGVLIGPSVLDWLPEFTQAWFPVLTDIALAMIGFLLGQSLTKKRFHTMGRPIIGISLSVMIATSLLIFFGLLVLGAPLEIALILAGIAPATAPAPVVDVVSEIKAKGDYTDTLLGIVAVDDAWGMLLFSLLLIIAAMSMGNGETMLTLEDGLWEVFGAVLLGLILGAPMAYLSGHIYPGHSSQAETLGLVLLCAGLAEWLHVSYILTAMVMGATVANLSKQHRHRPFKELETFEWPLLILFFLLAGSSLQIQALSEVGLIGIGYILFRVLGRIVGSHIGAKWAGCQTKEYRWIGLAMLPHAGIPIGMVLLASHHFPELKNSLLAVILGATIIFELVGPIITRQMLLRSGDAKLESEPQTTPETKV